MKPSRTETDRLCARAEELCREIAARDLADLPLYIVPQSRLPERLGRTSVCNGYTDGFLDLHLQDVIGSAWKGRGPCMVVNDIRPRGDTPEDAERLFLGTAVHELAHIVLRPRLYRDWPKAEPSKAEVEADAQRVVSFYTGNSAKAWYLFANPNVLAAFEIVFLNGRRTPIIERVEAPPNMLGMGFRGYIDVGVKEQDFRAAVKMKGEA